jgi:hypothetical protein
MYKFKTAAALVMLVSLMGCAKPTLSSIRPRGLDVFISGGEARDRSFGEQTVHGSIWQVGASLRWDISYKDEEKTIKGATE